MDELRDQYDMLQDIVYDLESVADRMRSLPNMDRLREEVAEIVRDVQDTQETLSNQLDVLDRAEYDYDDRAYRASVL